MSEAFNVLTFYPMFPRFVHVVHVSLFLQPMFLQILSEPTEMHLKHWAATVYGMSFASLNIGPVCFCVSCRNAAVICFLIGCNNVHKRHTHTHSLHIFLSLVFLQSRLKPSPLVLVPDPGSVCVQTDDLCVCVCWVLGVSRSWMISRWSETHFPLSRRVFLCCGDRGRKVNTVAGSRSMQMLQRRGGTLVTTNQLWLHTGPAYEAFICWCLVSLFYDTGGD